MQWTALRAAADAGPLGNLRASGGFQYDSNLDAEVGRPVEQVLGIRGPSRAHSKRQADVGTSIDPRPSSVRAVFLLGPLR